VLVLAETETMRVKRFVEIEKRKKKRDKRKHIDKEKVLKTKS
jgi:hypothetical protein